MLISLIKKAVCCLLFISICADLSAQHPVQAIPEFKFFKPDKKAFTNKDLAANKLLFIVFFDVTCDHCRHAMEKINQHYNEFDKTAIYLVSLDDQAGINNFMGHYGPNLAGKKNVTILQDLQNEFITKFKPVKYPSMFLFSPVRKLILYDDNEENVVKFLNQVKLNAKQIKQA